MSELFTGNVSRRGQTCLTSVALGTLRPNFGHVRNWRGNIGIIHWKCLEEDGLVNSLCDLAMKSCVCNTPQLKRILCCCCVRTCCVGECAGVTRRSKGVFLNIERPSFVTSVLPLDLFSFNHLWVCACVRANFRVVRSVLGATCDNDHLRSRTPILHFTTYPLHHLAPRTVIHP